MQLVGMPLQSHLQFTNSFPFNRMLFVIPDRLFMERLLPSGYCAWVGRGGGGNIFPYNLSSEITRNNRTALNLSPL